MSHCLEVFDQIYLQNLKRRADRLRHAQAEFARIRCPFGLVEVVEAIDGKVKQFKTDTVSRYHKHGRPLSSGYLANILTKRSIWEKALKTDGQSFLLMEDDFVFAKDFNDYFPQFWEALPADWDIVYFGCWDWMPDSAKQINEFVIKPRKPVLSHAVALSRRALGIMLNEFSCVKLDPNTNFVSGVKETYDVTMAEQLIGTGKLNCYAPNRTRANKLISNDPKFGSDNQSR